MRSIASLKYLRLCSSFCHFASGLLALALTVAAPPIAPAEQVPDTHPTRVIQAVDDSVLTTLRGNIHPLARMEFDQGPADVSLSADRMQLV